MTVDSREFDPDDRSVTDRGSVESSSGTNVGPRERAASAVVGGALVRRGLGRRSLGGVATALVGGALVYRGITGRSRLYRMLESDAAADLEQLGVEASTDQPTIERTVTVGEPADELAELWRDPDRVSEIVGEFADVYATMGSEDHHRWQVAAPFGRQLEWQTRLVEDRSGELLRWETLEGAPVPYEATVRFESAPGNHGTEVTLEIRYDPPGGSLGDSAMQRLGIVPETLAGTVLDRFKSLAETGEIPSLETNPSARGQGDRL